MEKHPHDRRHRRFPLRERHRWDSRPIVDGAADIASQAAEETWTVASPTEEQAAATSEMIDSAGELANEADELRELFAGFETEVQPTEQEVFADGSE